MRTDLGSNIPLGVTRWTSALKLRIVELIDSGTPLTAVQQVYPDLSAEEVDLWRERVHKHGRPGLRATRAQQYK